MFGDQTGCTIEVIFGDAIDVECFACASEDHFGDYLDVPADPNNLPRPIKPNPNTLHVTLFLAIKPLDHTMNKAKGHFIIIQPMQADSRRINHLQIRMIQIPRWIFGEQVGIVGFESVDCPAEIYFEFFFRVDDH